MCSKALRLRYGMIAVLCAAGLLACPASYGQDEDVDLDVPFVPTHHPAVEAMLNLAKVTSSDYVFDLGCGDGRIVVTAASKFKARGFGVDLDPQRIRESNANAAKAGVTDRVTFKLGNIMVTDIREANVIGLFLLDSVNLMLRPRLFAQLRPGSRVVSNSFHMADWKSDITIRHGEAYDGVIHLWIIPAHAGGTWRVKMEIPDGDRAAVLKLAQQFQNIAGTVSVADGAEAPIAEASLSGSVIKFTATSPVDGRNVRIAYEGTVEGDTMRGTQRWLGGPSRGTYLWTAKRGPVDLTGRWRVKAAERSGDSGTLYIQSKDGTLSATYRRDGQDRKEQPLPAFYAWGTSVRFEVPSDSGDSELVFTGDKTKWTAERIVIRASRLSDAAPSGVR